MQLLQSFALRLGRRVLAASLMAGCTACANVHQLKMAPGEQPTLVGSAVRINRTPMDISLSCLGRAVAARGLRAPVVAVGDVRDYTGKYSVNEGNAITQGGALMVTSALGKIGTVRVAERFDPTIGERELGYTDRRQLGDGSLHAAMGQGAATQVPWLPYYGGSIAASDFYIVGGITELNYDIRSGGFETAISQIGPKARIYTQSVAVDLRIVDTRSLLVLKTVSLTKQFTGYEVGLNLFRFFGSDLFVVGLGAKGQEPLQLGIRTALEEATIRLVGAVAHVDPGPCLALRSWTAPAAIPGVASMAAVPTMPTAAAAIKWMSSDSGADDATIAAVRFADGSADLPAGAAAMIARIGNDRSRRPSGLVILSRDNEPADPGRREPLTDRRIAAVKAAVEAAGIVVRVVWRPGANDSAVHRADAGFQAVARLSID